MHNCCKVGGFMGEICESGRFNLCLTCGRHLLSGRLVQKDSPPKATVPLRRLAIPSEKRQRNERVRFSDVVVRFSDVVIRFSAGLHTYLDVNRR